MRDRETGREVWITMIGTTGQGRAKFGIEAPGEVEILREEMIGSPLDRLVREVDRLKPSVEPTGAGEGSRGAAP